MWTDVFSAPGARTTGTGAQSLVLTPPGWAGEVPDECVHIPAPTVYVWAIGRTQTNGPADFAAVNAFQDDLRIERIDGGDARVHADIADLPSGIDMTQEPLTIVNTLSAVDFFAYAMRLLKVHPRTSLTARCSPASAGSASRPAKTSTLRGSARTSSSRSVRACARPCSRTRSMCRCSARWTTAGHSIRPASGSTATTTSSAPSRHSSGSVRTSQRMRCTR
ncbi:DUF1254 domain-containing protein [Microbacterium sp. NIBRBAC000506063]|nr:DUF1254 domain-containing protein [Microbacterium sp. NIBRBAC000506063]